MDLQYIGSIGGIAGILAVLMWLTIRHLISQMREDREFMEDRLTQILKDYNDVCKANQEATIRHTQIQTELITWLKARNGR